MKARLTSLRNSRLLSVLAVVSSVLLLTGETLNCCRLNESISRCLSELFGGPRNHATASHNEDSDHHAHCHGHAHESAPSLANVDMSGAALGATSTCISENSLTTKPMLPGGFSFLDIPALSPALPIGFEPAVPFHPERPRPQNKSSPPLYLTTLRILV